MRRNQGVIGEPLSLLEKHRSPGAGTLTGTLSAERYVSEREVESALNASGAGAVTTSAIISHVLAGARHGNVNQRVFASARVPAESHEQYSAGPAGGNQTFLENSAE
jgi:hypothetical protein